MKRKFQKKGRRIQEKKGLLWSDFAIMSNDVDDFLELDSGDVLVLLDIDHYSESANIYLLGPDGHIKWQIEPAPSADLSEREPYGEFSFEGDKFVASTGLGHFYEIDLQTGKIKGYVRWEK